MRFPARPIARPTVSTMVCPLPDIRRKHPPFSVFLLVLLFASLGGLLATGPSRAIYICGDGVCQSSGFPPETPQTCQADCGYCGDAICGYPETCSSCVSDCANTCLNFTLPSALEKSGCSGDDDGDCLDNAQESNLAWIVAPYYYYDEDESCAGAWYVPSPNATHYGRKDFVQVRPSGSRVDLWRAGGSTKIVWITYFLLHPHDCQSHFGFGGHQGDSEHVRFELRSVDLQKWVVTLGEYHHHNRVDNFSGAYLKARASEIGTVYPNVAGDEDGHGSWAGEKGSKSACAGSEDDFCLGACDCFKGDFDEAFANGYREVVSASRNIGGPAPELWRTSVVSTFGGGAYNWFDVGHGQVREYWTVGINGWQKFCGWECSQRYASSGDCAVSIHGETGCADGLSQKVDTRFFSNGAASVVQPAAEESSALRGQPELSGLRSEVAEAVYSVPELPYETARSWKERIAGAWDPVAEVIPLLEGRSRSEQLATLRWMLTAAPDKLESAPAEGLLDPTGFTEAERRWIAGEVVHRLVEVLERRGLGDPGPASEALQSAP